jgi:hypothetical protein
VILTASRWDLAQRSKYSVILLTLCSAALDVECPGPDLFQSKSKMAAATYRIRVVLVTARQSAAFLCRRSPAPGTSCSPFTPSSQNSDREEVQRWLRRTKLAWQKIEGVCSSKAKEAQEMSLEQRISLSSRQNAPRSPTSRP